MDILKQVETLIEELERSENAQDPEVRLLTELIKPYKDSAKAHRWKRAHDTLQAISVQLMKMMSEVMTEAMNNAREIRELMEHNKPIPVDVLESYKSDLAQISRGADEVSQRAAMIHSSIDKALE